VTPEAARELYTRLRLELEPIRATVAGLNLWRYLGGPWSLCRDLPFGGATSTSPSAIRCG
jgi:hypothetical protein